jgi:hypothetical protein
MQIKGPVVEEHHRAGGRAWLVGQTMIREKITSLAL